MHRQLCISHDSHCLSERGYIYTKPNRGRKLIHGIIISELLYKRQPSVEDIQSYNRGCSILCSGPLPTSTHTPPVWGYNAELDKDGELFPAQLPDGTSEQRKPAKSMYHRDPSYRVYTEACSKPFCYIRSVRFQAKHATVSWKAFFFFFWKSFILMVADFNSIIMLQCSDISKFRFNSRYQRIKKLLPLNAATLN